MSHLSSGHHSRKPLRRLSFDDCQGPASSSSISQSPESFQGNKGAPFSQKTAVNSDREVLCGGWMDCGSELPRLDKISELDSMMAEGESSNSQVSQLPLASSSSSRSPDFDATQIPELDFCSNLLADPGTAGEDQTTSLTQETTHCDVEVSDRAGDTVENPGQPTKRKCPTELSISSPSKLSKLK